MCLRAYRTAKAKISLRIRGRAMRKYVFGRADIEGPDQTARMRSLIRVFTVRYQKQWILQNIWLESKSPDDTLRMRRMIWMCILRMFEGTFSLNTALMDQN